MERLVTLVEVLYRCQTGVNCPSRAAPCLLSDKMQDWKILIAIVLLLRWGLSRELAIV